MLPDRYDSQRERTDFDDRLAAAYVILGRAAARQLPVDRADQAHAAARDARVLLDRIGAVETLLEPGRFEGRRVLDDPGQHRQARIVAGVIACTPCFHLRKSGPQPGVVTLPTRRASCTKCARTVRRPVVPDDRCDRCDLCGVHVPDEFFWPLRAQLGGLLVLGDMCRDCAHVIHPERVA